MEQLIIAFSIIDASCGIEAHTTVKTSIVLFPAHLPSGVGSLHFPAPADVLALICTQRHRGLVTGLLTTTTIT